MKLLLLTFIISTSFSFAEYVDLGGDKKNWTCTSRCRINKISTSKAYGRLSDTYTSYKQICNSRARTQYEAEKKRNSDCVTVCKNSVNRRNRFSTNLTSVSISYSYRDIGNIMCKEK
jgi:hypothetical protein